MHFTIDVNLQFSIFGLVIFGLWAYGAYRGYKRGVITMTISLFIILAGLLISAIAGFWIAVYFYHNHSNVPQVFGSLILVILFSLAIWISNFVQKIVFLKIKEVDPVENFSKILGATLGFLKYFVITGVFSLAILNFNSAGNFLPERDKNSYIMNTNAWLMTKLIRPLNYPSPQTGPTIPKKLTSPNNNVIKNNNTTQNPNNKVIPKPNTTQNTNNVPKNNLVTDVQNP